MLCSSQVGHMKITHNFIRALLTEIVSFQYTQQFYQQSPTFEQKHVLFLCENWFPFSVATGAQVCVMTHCPCNGVDAGFQRTEQVKI